TFGPWMLGAFKALAKLRFLRGGLLDPFARTAERKSERALIAEYEETMGEVLAGLGHDNHALAVEIAGLPEHIRGYGHVKERHLAAAEARRAELLETWRHPATPKAAAE
ncbi:MAG: indolepyruvate ferredoxin oxidoreductase, partial [Xanthomonadales bacterium]|nr:indolepyruvate ferredoxin oxidoreductase [Xanthomonadales bacterium]